MVAALPDGEDSAGRQKLRLMDADELACHATDCADVVFSMFYDRGWIKDMPSYQEYVDMVRNRAPSNE